VKIPKPTQGLVELFDAVLAGTDGERRLMFGNPAGFLGGNLFCGVFGSSMFVRLSEADRATLLKVEGAALFDPMGGRPMKEYVVLPPELAEDERGAARWMARAASFAASLPVKKAGQKKKVAKKKR
jgi:hypothetical protein